jgi:hypothetical protein
MSFLPAVKTLFSYYSNLLLEEARDSHVLSAAPIAAFSFGILFFFVC